MNHLHVDDLVAATLLRSPPPHQLEDGVNQFLLKSQQRVIIRFR